MLSITISPRAVLLAGALVFGGALAFYATAALGSGGPDTIIQGDTDCDGDVDAEDALIDLRFVGGLEVQQTEPCPDVGTQVAIASSGLSDLEIVEVATAEDSTDKKSLETSCPAGKKAISGGAVTLGDAAGEGNVAIAGSQSFLSMNGWESFATEVNPTSSNWYVRLRVLCATVAD